MPSLFRSLTIAALAIVAASSADAACSRETADDAITACLVQDFSATQARINAIYKAQMQDLEDQDRVALRKEQSTWLGRRESACAAGKLDADDKRLQSIAAHPLQAVCVARFDFERVAQLDQLNKLKPPAFPIEGNAPSAPQFPGKASGSAPAGLSFIDDYSARLGPVRDRGKWYLELWIDRGRIAQFGDALLVAGVFGTAENAQTMVNVRRVQIDMQPAVVGVALDADSAQAWLRNNEQWKTAPGAGPGVAVGRGAAVGLNASTSLRELLARGVVRINLGERPFAQPLPDGFQPWGAN